MTSKTLTGKLVGFGEYQEAGMDGVLPLILEQERDRLDMVYIVCPDEKIRDIYQKEFPDECNIKLENPSKNHLEDVYTRITLIE